MNNCKYELQIGLIIPDHFYDKKYLNHFIYEGLN